MDSKEQYTEIIVLTQMLAVEKISCDLHQYNDGFELTTLGGMVRVVECKGSMGNFADKLEVHIEQPNDGIPFPKVLGWQSAQDTFEYIKKRHNA